MGNKGSEFENEFYKRYTFIQCIDDQIFGFVKIYRKNTIKYDYIMIMDVKLEDLHQNDIQVLDDRLQRIKSNQNETTLRIYHFKFVSPAQIQCSQKRLIIYAEYINRNINDYFSALRSNQKFVLDVSEIIYVLKNITKSVIVLKKMGIMNPDLCSRKIFMSTEGEVLLCPLLYILQSLKGTACYNQINLLQNRYLKYSISQLKEVKNAAGFPLKQKLMNLLLQMTGHLPLNKLEQTNQLLKILQKSKSLEEFEKQIPYVDAETIRIQQMHRMETIPGQFTDLS